MHTEQSAKGFDVKQEGGEGALCDSWHLSLVPATGKTHPRRLIRQLHTSPPGLGVAGSVVRRGERFCGRGSSAGVLAARPCSGA